MEESLAIPLRAPAAWHRSPGPPLPWPGNPRCQDPGEKKNVLRFETYQARGRPLRATAAAVAAAAAAPGAPRAPWRTERALDAGGSQPCRASAPRPARAQLHSPRRGRSSPSRAPQLVPRGAEAGRELEVVGSAARPRPDLLPSAAGERGGGVGTGGRRKRAGGGGGPGPEGRWRPRSAPRGDKVFLSPWGSRRAGWGWRPPGHPSNPSAFRNQAPNPGLQP